MKTDFRALTEREVIDILRVPAPTLVLFHVRPDGDAVGSAFALSLWLSAMGSPAFCLSEDEVPEYLRFLSDGLQESTRLPAVPAAFENARVISVDTPSPAQLGYLFEKFGDRVTLMIDHHGKGTPYADHYIRPEAAAAGEIVYDLIAASGVDMPPRSATLLYAAISADTGGFRFSNTTKETHLRAAALLDAGIDAAEINRRLFDCKSYKTLLAERTGFDHLHLFADGRVAIITIPYEVRAALGLSEEHMATLIDMARSVAGVDVAAALRQSEPGGSYHVSLRANADVDVSAIAAVFGGGGHKRAAGCGIAAKDADEAEAKLVAAVLGAL